MANDTAPRPGSIEDGTETFDVRYYREPTIVEALRCLAADLEGDSSLTLIGLWSVEGSDDDTENDLQVALSATA